ncbi:hypothetical protein BS47DRAFT_1299428 [Hydnum rufescens UP504]|uniref:Dihydrodipicolinate synthase n=1 Tax=Hydnum rufescens UP504 TaxID=1448309 RepID=A0A9P6ASE9_9AGAM|nr:hypothetical protein BS47DRAFT_1299428 [Hydnum rufescens UP504]
MASHPRKLVRGIYVPVATFFLPDEDQSLDLETHKEHILWIARAGVHGILVQGSTGEAVALTPEEKIQLTSTTRKVLDENGYHDVILIVGAGAQSTGEAISLARDAAKAGGDYIMVLPPAYFASSITAEAVEGYYTEIADKSPLPVLIYSYPTASGGLEVTADSIQRLAKHPNIVGVKQTDHNVAKMARNAYKTDPATFSVLAGATDYLIGALAVGAKGAITGLGNIAPRLSLRLFDLWESGQLSEARELQGLVASGEWALLQAGIPGIKAGVHLFFCHPMREYNLM